MPMKTENKTNHYIDLHAHLDGCITVDIDVYKRQGMMCGHCEAHVNKAIQAAFGAEDVVSSHENGTTVFSVPEKVDEAKVEEVIKEAGYEFKGITQE